MEMNLSMSILGFLFLISWIVGGLAQSKLKGHGSFLLCFPLMVFLWHHFQMNSDYIMPTFHNHMYAWETVRKAVLMYFVLTQSCFSFNKTCHSGLIPLMSLENILWCAHFPNPSPLWTCLISVDRLLCAPPPPLLFFIILTNSLSFGLEEMY